MRFKKWFSILSFGDTRKYLKLLAWFMIDSIVATIPYGIVLLAIYFLLGPITNPGSPLDTGTLWKIVLILAIQAVCYLLVRMKSYIMSCCGMAEEMKKSRMDIGEHLRKLPLGFFRERDAGELSTVLLRDFTTIENLANNFAPQIAITLIRLLLSFVFLAVFDLRMAVALFITIPCAIPFALFSYQRLAVSETDLSTAQQDAASGILEYVEGIQTLKAFHAAGDHFEKLKNSFARQREAAVHIETKSAAPVAIAGKMVLNLGIAITMLLGGLLTAHLALSPFYYIAFLVMALNIYEPVSTMFLFIADFARTRLANARIAEIYAQKPLCEITVPKKTVRNNTICFEDVTFGYTKDAVLKHISVTFPEKKITALVGPSGSGKSTLTKLIARFWDVNSGQITLGGVPLKEMSTEQLLSKIAMVFQNVYLFHDTIANNIKMGNENATMEEVAAAAKKASCHEFIMSLPDGYDTMVGEGGSTLSGGEKQRISIARALLKDAPIILLDEATASLDPENEVLIQSAISALVHDKTVIIVAHRLQSITNADQIVVLDDGQIIENGTHEALLQKGGMYARLWEDQSKAGIWRIN